MNSKTLTYTLQDTIKNEGVRKKLSKISKSYKIFYDKKSKTLVQVYIHMINFVIECYSKDILVNQKQKRIEDLFDKEMLKEIQPYKQKII